MLVAVVSEGVGVLVLAQLPTKALEAEGQAAGAVGTVGAVDKKGVRSATAAYIDLVGLYGYAALESGTKEEKWIYLRSLNSGFNSSKTH